MNEEVKRTLTSYLSSANFGITHPLDIERFYEFIIVSYKEGILIDSEDFENMVKEKAPGIDDKWLSKKYSLYENGIELLKKYNK